MTSFLALFLGRAMLSVYHDMSYGSTGMDPVKEFMQTKGSFAKSWSHMLSGMRDKPISRCENCTKSPEEIGPNVKFMLCSVCKTKLDFIVHYCSQ
jgi:hypothetical protein